MASYRFSRLTQILSILSAGQVPHTPGRRKTRMPAPTIEFLEQRLVLASDFGDAPFPYPTLLADDGAHHVAIGPQLGSLRDTESDGTPSLAANGDDSAGGPNDEDGVAFGTLRIGALHAVADVTVQGATAGAQLFAWIDFNRDGAWGGPGETVISGLSVTNGVNHLTFEIPSWAAVGETYARFRITTDDQIGPRGTASDGEVEDYLVTLLPPGAATAEFPSARAISTFADAPYALAAADLDQDGDWDLISASSNDNMIAWYENQGDQQFVAHVISNTAGNPQTVFAVDLDQDGDSDILAVSYETGEVSWYENQSGQAFAYHLISDAVALPLAVTAADIDGDGDIDVLSASRDNRILLFRNDGLNGFAQVTISATSLGSAAVTTADMNRDGRLDIVAASSFDNSVVWFENRADGQFTPRTITTEAVGVFTFAVADFDHDGDLDVVAASVDDTTLAWYENDGSQSFTRHVITDTIAGAFSIAVADLDGDGDLDILSAAAFDNSVAWYENDAQRSFQRHTLSSSSPEAGAVLAIDLDRDGDLDVVAASAGDDLIQWFENTNPITLLASGESASEAAQTVITLTATAATAVNEDKLVDLSLTGAGITPADYLLSAPRITIPKGQTSGTITLTILNDNIVEGIEILSVTTGTLSPGLDQGDSSPHSITISDNDANALVVNPTTVVEGDIGETILLVPVTSPVATSGSFTVTFQITSLTAANTDYTLITNGPLTFAGLAGEVQTIEIHVHGDINIEGDETFTITLGPVAASNPQIVQQVLTGASATQTILNDDFADLSIVGAGDASEANTSQAAGFSINLSRVVTTDTIVFLSVAGTATMGSQADFTPVPESVTIPAGQLSTLVPIQVIDDILVEGIETVSLTISVQPGQPRVQLSPDSGLRMATITLVDNDTPLFVTASTVEVAENAPAPNAIITVHAIVTHPTIPATYTLSGADAQLFQIDSSTGAIRFVQSPDYESPLDSDGNNVYQLTVTATVAVSPLASSDQQLQVIVTPVNEHAPAVNAPSTVTVIENSGAEAVLVMLTTSDADLPRQTLTYSLTGPDAHLFQISSTGALRFLSSPDFEDPADADRDNQYDVTLSVSDNAQPARVTSQTVVIRVLPTNDNRPQFETISPQFSLPENSPNGTVVGVIHADDADSPSQSVSYAISSGNLNGVFAIDPATGAVSVANGAGLDYETQPTFQLLVVATDDGTPSLTAELWVTIHLTDVSDSLELQVGAAATWTNKQPPALILPEIQVRPAANLGGGTLTITAREVRTKRSALDLFQLATLLTLGDSTGPVSQNDMLTFEVRLNPNITSADVQSALRGITFSTRGKGLKVASRQMTIRLTDSANHSVEAQQTIRVLKGRK